MLADENIFVNPAWNLGAQEARFPLLIISNDDLAIDPGIIDAAAQILRLPVGIAGPDAHAFRASGAKSFKWALPAYERTIGFGTLMFMRRENYRPIPEDLLIWVGDQWLFHRQHHRNVHLKGWQIVTEMETTSGLPQFNETKRRDGTIYTERYQTDAYARRFWLGPLVLGWASRVSRTLRGARKRQRPVTS